MSMATGSESFVDKWLVAEPWHRLLLVFEPSATRVARQLLESIGFELRSAALDSSDARVAGGKLAWWAEEWRLLAAGTPRHPLTVALRVLAVTPVDSGAGAAWANAALALASDDSDPDIDAWLARWRPFAAAQWRAAAAWLPAAEQPGSLPAADSGRHVAETGATHAMAGGDTAAAAHAMSLACERLAWLRVDLQRGRLPLPLSILASHRLDRGGLDPAEPRAHAAIDDLAGQLRSRIAAARRHAGVDGYRRGQLALAQLRTERLQRHPADAWRGVTHLPPIRAVYAAWRARVARGSRGA